LNFRIEDDAALTAKVDEALSVYDDYMHNRAGGPQAGANGAAKEDASNDEGAKPTAA
jgi:hypothetical protein